MHDGHLGVVQRAGGQVVGQPRDQPVHLRDGLGDGRLVLLAPALDLAAEVVARAAEVRQAHRLDLDVVQRRQHPVHLVVHGGALARLQARQRLLPEHPAVDEVHHIEGPADDGFVVTQHMHARHRHAAEGQRVHHAELTLDGVGRRQQLGQRPGLGPHHILAPGRDQLEGGVRLPALELLDRQRASEARQPGGEPARECVGVEGMLLRDSAAACELLHGMSLLTLRRCRAACRATAPRDGWVPPARRLRARSP